MDLTLLMSCLISILSFLVLQEVSSNSNTSTIVVAIMLPSAGLDRGVSWERREEIVLGAYLARDMINQDPTILPGTTLKLIEVGEGMCGSQFSPANAIVDFVKYVWVRETVSGVVGLLCSGVEEYMRSFHIVQISGALYSARNQKYPYQYHVGPSAAAIAEATVEVMKYFGWTHVGMITDSADIAHLYVVEAIVKSGESIALFYETAPGSWKSFERILRALEHANVNVAVLSAGVQTVAALLCHAHRENMKWPEFGWIVPHLEAGDLVSNAPCNGSALLDGVMFVNTLLKHSSSMVNTINNSVLQQNLYAGLLYDSVWAFAIALNQTYNPNTNSLQIHSVARQLSNLSFHGFSGLIQFNEGMEVTRSVSISRLWKSFTEDIGMYDPSKGLWLNTNKVKPPYPTIKALKESVTLTMALPLAVVSLTVSVLCFVLTTGIAILYLCFRSQPEIKATSPYLSLPMILGIYLLLIGALLHLMASISPSPALSFCNIILWMNSVGFCLIFAPLLVRLMRIHRIFNSMKAMEGEWSDRVLLLWTLLLVSVMVLINALWTATDKLHAKKHEDCDMTTTPPLCKVMYLCYSTYLHFWVLLVLAYVAILMLSVMVLAFRTRKIRLSNFKDTKVINVFLMMETFFCIYSLSLWGALRIIGNIQDSDIIYFLGNILLPMTCLLLIFGTKVWPPLKQFFDCKQN